MDNSTIGGQELRDKISAGMKVYDDKSFIERFGIFMGKAQLLEFGLKKILASLPGFALEKKN